ncbi:MAG TPA: thioredoxin domain-containing protein [Pyrinomonadaceae bacterium]|nr:thioredoxin domain-containing protein [Pyrinomonadaceae bacterium]
MKSLKVLLLASFLLIPMCTLEASQRRRNGRPAAAPAASPAPAASNPIATTVAAVPATASAPVPVAIVNGQTLTTADLDPRIRQEIESLDEKVARARREMLDVTINTILLDLEAKKRGVTTAQLFNQEVSKRIPEPTANEITKFIEDNRGRNEPIDDAIRKQAAELMRANAGKTVQEQFVARLRKLNPVVMGVNINTPNLGPSAVIATIAGQPLIAGPVLEKLKPAIFKLRMDTYELEKTAVDRLINDMLAIAEANRRKIGPEVLLRTEITEKVRRPTDAEVAKFYEENRKEIREEFNAVRDQVAVFLEERDRQRLESELSERLRRTANIRMLIQEPVAPTIQISVDDDPSRGPATAPVTIVEFSDFQCPACAAMHPVIETVVKSYGDKVRFVMRDFPLTMHENARKAAEAANAAHAQGKFFEYAALLYQRQQSLDPASLKKYASELGLDRVRFDAALDKGTYAAEVQHDMVDGDKYGVDRTPTIFVNGMVLGTLSEEGLRAAIDRALASPKPKAP